MMLAAFPVPAAAQENLVEDGDFSQGLEHWIVGGPANPCEPGNLSEPGGYYGCVMVTDEGTPGNPHLELWTGTGGEYGIERFEQDVSQNSLRLPKDAGRITMSLRVWSLGNTSYVPTLIQTGSKFRASAAIFLVSTAPLLLTTEGLFPDYPTNSVNFGFLVRL